MSPAMADAVRYHQYLFDCLSPFLGQRVIEVGIGNGQYTRRMLDHGCSVLGVDIDQEAIEAARSSLPNSNAAFALCDIGDRESFLQHASEFRPDTLFCVNVLEHIREDKSTLYTFAQALSRRGRLILLVPAHEFLWSKMDEDAGHFRRYTRNDLNAGLGKEWRVLRSQYINFPGIPGWWLADFLSRMQGFSKRGESSLNSSTTNRLILFYDRFFTAASRWCDPVFKNIAGLSLIAIAEKV